MNYGLYLSASGLQTATYRLNVHASNLANVNTPGFKPDLPVTRQRDNVHVEDGVQQIPGNRILDGLGGGVLMAPNRIETAQAPLETTDRPLDAAIEGKGFFVVRAAAGNDGLRLSRDGRFTINREGNLVQASSGFPVLGDNDTPITLQRDVPAEIRRDGTIFQGGKIAGRLQVSRIADERLLRKAGDNALSAPLEMTAKRTRAAGEVLQGSIERSGVDPVKATLAIAEAERSATRAARMLQNHDEVMQRAIDTFGRIG
ncbi:flagellar hook basal-body protein [soil metagenome]